MSTSPQDLALAGRVLAQVLRARWTGERLDAAAAEAVKPEAFEQIVKLHGVAGVLQLRHASLLQALPPDLLTVLPTLRRRATVLALMQVRALRELVTTLEAAGIATLPLKGLALSWRLYGDIGIRQSGDIDVLVDVDAVPDAVAALLALGYQPTQPLPDRALHWRERMRVVHHVNLQHANGAYVELHWRTDPLRSTSLPRLATLLPTLGRIESGPLQGLRTLPLPALQASLASHACRSRVARWKWGYDLLEIVSTAHPGTRPWSPALHTELDPYTRRTMQMMAAQWSMAVPVSASLRVAGLAAAVEREQLMGRQAASASRGLLLHAGAWAALQDWPARAEYLAWVSTRVSPDVGEAAYSLVARKPWLAPLIRAWAAARRRS